MLAGVDTKFLNKAPNLGAWIPPCGGATLLGVSYGVDTKLGHPYRHMDRVSIEIQSAMRRVCITRAVAISLAVRYKSSPRGFACKLATATDAEFRRLVRKESNGVAYRQTGCTKEGLSVGILDVADVLVARLCNNRPQGSTNSQPSINLTYSQPCLESVMGWILIPQDCLACSITQT